MSRRFTNAFATMLVVAGLTWLFPVPVAKAQTTIVVNNIVQQLSNTATATVTVAAKH